MGAKMTRASDARPYREVTDAVHQEGGKIALQILHSGRYSYSPFGVQPSDTKSPISPWWAKAWPLPDWGVHKTIENFATTAMLAKDAGFDGVEIMGSEGYLINEFLTQQTNHRTDSWGGEYENRMRFPLEILRETRKKVGDDFIVIFRLSMLDLVERGSSLEEVQRLAEEVAKPGMADIINTGIGWHEARVPTIQTKVPRAAFSWVTQRVKSHLTSKGLNIPLVAVNRINTPEVAESILEKGEADMISMARPLLADAYFVSKAEAGKAEEINTCIGCNQACLDHTFRMERATCLVNPYACYEDELELTPVLAQDQKRVCVIGAGPAGCAAAMTAAQRGHHVTLIDADDKIGGQFNIAASVPGKEEFHETIRYFRVMLEKHFVKTRLGVKVDPTNQEQLNKLSEEFDEFVIATGVLPRKVSIETDASPNAPNVISYLDVLKYNKPVGKRVAVVGAGGIGFDVSEYLTSELEDSKKPSLHPELFFKEWGVDMTMQARGGVAGVRQEPEVSPRQVYLLQRKTSKVGKGLGTTTGWIHRLGLRKKNVEMVAGCSYDKIDADGFHITTTTKVKGEELKQQRTLEVDTVVLCAGQEPLRELQAPLEKLGKKVHLIGGADVAAELDAKRAVRQGTEVALKM
eukprot:TRINITY_DN35703_c0_g1_i1.p1 TRINITY_DN35703_c0_g1~~TRINITY_DN35703_c0_g1_i1.p1  ORF type:complete len:721 (+),score=321.85 TRINITY_DN35703_c0_g1_i1:262-2163(+)